MPWLVAEPIGKLYRRNYRSSRCARHPCFSAFGSIAWPTTGDHVVFGVCPAYSQGDDITHIQLSSDGNSVIRAESLAGGFSDPLPLVEGPDGTIYVGELGGDRVTALVPAGGTWVTKAPVPAAGPSRPWSSLARG